MNYCIRTAKRSASRAARRVLNPARVVRERTVDARAAEAYSAPPLELEVIDGAVDWNATVVIEREPVRAGLAVGDVQERGAPSTGSTARAGRARFGLAGARRNAGPAARVLLDAQGQLWRRSGASSGPDADGSCPNGDATRERCMNLVRRRASGRGPACARSHSQGSRHRRAARARLQRCARSRARRWLELAGAELKVLGDRALPAAQSGHALGLALTPALQLMWPTPRAVCSSSRARRARRPVRARARARRACATDREGSPGARRAADGELCGVFPDADAYLRFYCYDAARDRWADLSLAAFYAGLGPHTAGAVALAFHRYRAADGTPLDRTRGALYLSFTEPESQDAHDPDNPHFLISRALSARAGAFQAIDFRWRGSVINQWTKVVHGTALALYEDESLSALKR